MKPVSVDVLLALAVLAELVCVVGVMAGATVFDDHARDVLRVGDLDWWFAGKDDEVKHK